MIRSLSLVVLPVLVLTGRPHGRAECRCPAFTAASPVLLVTDHGGARGLLVCGYLDARHGRTIRASEFDIVRCRDGKTVLEFDATETAELTAVGEDLRVTRVSKWPIGQRWNWEYLPIASVTVQADGAELPLWEPRLRRPVLSRRLIDSFVAQYERAMAAGSGAYAPDEDAVGKLFVAALSGNVKARELFCGMPRQARLDGANAEDYGSAVHDLWRGTHHARFDAEPDEGWCADGFRLVAESSRASRMQ